MGSSHVDWVPPESFDEYRLVKALGRGSRGQVWLAHDTVLDRLVAVKFIAELPVNDAVRHRFLTEARAAARVQHPNITAAYRAGATGRVAAAPRERDRPRAWPRGGAPPGRLAPRPQAGQRDRVGDRRGQAARFRARQAAPARRAAARGCAPGPRGGGNAAGHPGRFDDRAASGARTVRAAGRRE